MSGFTVGESWSDVAATFQAHFAHYAAHGGGENALVGLRAEGSVTLQYAGRVVYELFQNALDQAGVRCVSVVFDGRVLVVGNDGAGIAVEPRYDYGSPIEGEGRSDFHALCALHTSNKSPDRQFGNKGIGFRSVFGVADRVQVWSRCADGGWWGLELKQRLVPGEWLDSALPELDALVRRLGPQPRPSFHFPRPIRSLADPMEGLSDVTTLVRVEVDSDTHRTQIRHEVDRLQATRFQFVELRRPGLVFRVNAQTVLSGTGWGLVSDARHHAGFPELAELARQAHHPIPAPRVAVAWPSEPTGDEPSSAGYFYNHLPTRMSTGLPVDLHADFQVKADREGMALEPDSDVGRYNLALLAKAAGAHLEALGVEARRDNPRRDFWRLANRPDGAPAAWIAALKDALFPGAGIDRWVDLASAFFRDESAELPCREFWQASQRWLEGIVNCGPWTQTWESRARTLCAALSERAVRVMPVVSNTGHRAVALPSRPEAGQRAARRVFYWSPRGDAEIPPVPETLLASGRVVTSFDLSYFKGPAGIQPFSEAQVLPELRQIPNDPSAQDLRQPLSAEEQGNLLLFAFRLTASRRRAHFAWRAFTDSDEEWATGRALSTMYLPTLEGAWEPARQLTEDAVDQVRMSALLGVSTPLWDFLRTLGVAPPGAVPLVEGGEGAVLPPLPSPPAPQEPGTGRIAALAPLLTPGTPLHGVAASLNGLKRDGESLRTGGGSPRSEVFERVRTGAWLSASHFRTFDGVPPLPGHVAPVDVVLHTRDPQRIFFAVPTLESEYDALASVGAVQRPDDETQAARVPAVLRALRSRLPSPASLPASVAQSLAHLNNRLLAILPMEGSDPVPVLVECSGRQQWLDAGGEAWLSQTRERQELRRFFPDLALVAAEHRAGLAGRLGVREVWLRKQVQPAVVTGQETPRAQALRHMIEPHLAVLAAVADQSRQATARLSEERFHRAWHLQRPLVEVEDAWVEIRVEGPERDPIPWRQGEHDDVFHLPGRSESDPGVILFDRPRDGAAAGRSLPLRYFGDALATLLVNNVALGPLFAQALASIDENRLHDFIERNHLADLVKEWTSRLRPMSDADRDDLLERLGALCTEPAAVLLRGSLGRGDLCENLAIATVGELEALLLRELRPELARYLPGVTIAVDNDTSWRRWWEHRKAPLAALALSRQGFPSGWRTELHALARRGFNHIDFSPSGVVATAMAAWGEPIDELERRLDELSPRFLPVLQPPMAVADVGWRAGRGTSGAGGGGPHRRLTAEDVFDETVARSMVGDAAELALLSWVVEQAQCLRERPGFKDALLSALPAKSNTWREVGNALDNGQLQDALHVSKRWSGAGFDMLGLEEVNGALRPIRYECKALSGVGARVRIHLSRNELGVARKIRREGPGRWLLVGVQESGESVDLTSLIEDLLDDDERPMEALYERGLEPDGLRLLVDRRGSIGRN